MRVHSKFLTAGLAVLMVAGVAHALPFNTDMYDPQPKTGEVMRPKVPDTVALGSLDYRVESREAALKLENPLKGDTLSTLSGKRLFSIHCSPCHGVYSEVGAYTASWFAPRVYAPDLSLPMYWDVEGGRTDGSVYGTIHFGSPSTLMPAYGWKLSPTEHWDIVNYLRSFQKAKSKVSPQ